MCRSSPSPLKTTPVKAPLSLRRPMRHSVLRSVPEQDLGEVAQMPEPISLDSDKPSTEIDNHSIMDDGFFLTLPGNKQFLGCCLQPRRSRHDASIEAEAGPASPLGVEEFGEIVGAPEKDLFDLPMPHLSLQDLPRHRHKSPWSHSLPPRRMIDPRPSLTPPPSHEVSPRHTHYNDEAQTLARPTLPSHLLLPDDF